jgi:hypothetical protein
VYPELGGFVDPTTGILDAHAVYAVTPSRMGPWTSDLGESLRHCADFASSELFRQMLIDAVTQCSRAGSIVVPSAQLYHTLLPDLARAHIPDIQQSAAVVGCWVTLRLHGVICPVDETRVALGDNGAVLALLATTEPTGHAGGGAASAAPGNRQEQRQQQNQNNIGHQPQQAPAVRDDEDDDDENNTSQSQLPIPSQQCNIFAGSQPSGADAADAAPRAPTNDDDDSNHAPQSRRGHRGAISAPRSRTFDAYGRPTAQPGVGEPPSPPVLTFQYGVDGASEE